MLGKMSVRWEMHGLQESDGMIERLWEELTDVPFDEDENGEMILAVPWHGFQIGTPREDIWHAFDERHSKGVYYLLYEYDMKG